MPLKGLRPPVNPDLASKSLRRKQITLFERPLFPGLYLTIVYNYKTIAVPNSSLNPAHPIAIAQAKPQPKDQMRVVLTFKLTVICRPKRACLT